jgi:hypothetical protein
MGSLFEDSKEDQVMWKDIAPLVDTLAEFIVNLTTAQYECEAVSLHLLDLVS